MTKPAIQANAYKVVSRSILLFNSLRIEFIHTPYRYSSDPQRASVPISQPSAPAPAEFSLLSSQNDTRIGIHEQFWNVTCRHVRSPQVAWKESTVPLLQAHPSEQSAEHQAKETVQMSERVRENSGRPPCSSKDQHHRK